MEMIRNFLVLLLVTAVIAKNIPDEDDDLGRLVDPFGEGEFAINHTAYRQALNLFLDTNIDVYAPNATGNFPVIYFITGLGGIVTYSSCWYECKTLITLISGIVPAEAHTLLLTQMASHGFVVVSVWKLGSPEDSFDPAWFEAAVEFVETRLENSLKKQEGIVYSSYFNRIVN